MSYGLNLVVIVNLVYIIYCIKALTSGRVKRIVWIIIM